MKVTFASPEPPPYDFSKLIADKKAESQYQSFSFFIDEKIREFRDKYYDGNSRRFNRYELAKMLKMEPSTLTKILNKTQPTRKRDVVIATCVALQLSESETNLALDLYPMAPLNPNNLRDLVIIHVLRAGLSVNELNDHLVSHKMHPLNLLRGNAKSEESSFYYPFNSTAYIEESVDILPYCLDESAETSLRERYHPDIFLFSGQMIIRNKSDPSTRYRIEMDRGADYDIFRITDAGEELLYSDCYLRQKYENASPCEDAELLREISKLKEYLDRKARYVYQMCGDTRNYQVRLNAVNKQGQLVIYGESFGYDAPERCEYYQIDISSHSCSFSVSNSSRFMARYLGEAEWLRLYGITLSPPVNTFRSLSEISDVRWQKHFSELMDSARKLLVQLQRRELFLNDARAWMNIEELMHMYRVEEAFDCYQADEELQYYLIPRKDQIPGSDGKPITVDDLWRAAELGINSVDELCDIRKRYGSLEGFLKIDALSEQG